ncbi:MAG TPA: xanthine dehydrogenase molybdopterin binding subunit [Pirellulales bacterium]|nr:xanthine dehydrogenase molybdopterin binding subunit [Pirellulales bacterium]
MGVVGQDIPHDSARGHVTGQSVFIDDMPPVLGELWVEIVGSPVAHGRLRGVDASEARKIPGIVAVVTAHDIPGHKRFGPVVADDVLLAEEELAYVGQPIALVAGEDRRAVARAKRLVKLDIDTLHPVFTIDEAIAQEQFLGAKRVIACGGDVDAALAAAPQTLEGVLTIGGQEHFYLESQCAIAYPGEQDTLVVHSSTQHPTEVQMIVGEVCHLPFHRVTVICKRMGGGFGGKETQAAQPAAMAALVARLTGRATRMVLERDEDMAITGKRHPYKSWYKVGFDHEGRITALAVDHYANGGYSTDLSLSVLERAMLHTDNAYFLPVARITGRVCRTNLPSNTAFRGFGGPQGVAVIENILEEIAQTLRRDAADVRRANCYRIDERNTTPYGQIVRNNVLPDLIDRLRVTSDYDRRRAEIALANAENHGAPLRGLAMTMVKFGISFTKRTLNQANALVNVYLDGSVAVSTGGTEMGQGVNTRVRQLVADDLGIGYDAVLVAATSTDKNNNTSPTAASCGTDLNGAAALDACSRIKARLAAFAAPLRADPAAGLAASPGHVAFADGQVFDARAPANTIAWRDLVLRAYQERVNLGERGFYATPGVDFNRDTGQGQPFLYFTNGGAVAEVAIDRFTGELTVARVDILMDIGMPINPGIDRGQIVGGFVQGMGWATTEELKYNERGELLSHSPTTYKIPNVSDLPEQFHLALYPNSANEVSLKRSKAVGEPPLLLGFSVWAAVKNALAGVAVGEVARLDLPATGEEILLRLHALEQLMPVETDELAEPTGS